MRYVITEMISNIIAVFLVFIPKDHNGEKTKPVIPKNMPAKAITRILPVIADHPITQNL